MKTRRTAIAMLAGAVAVVGPALWLGDWPVLRAGYLGINALALVCYGFDKYRAVAGGRRIPEATLLAMAFAGGAGGSLLAQGLFNHKTSKRSFRRAFWSIVLLQAGLIAALAVWLGRG